jgi:hypothetical protein
LWSFPSACNEKQVRWATPILLSSGQGSFDLFDELIDNEDVDFGYQRRGRLILFTSEASF